MAWPDYGLGLSRFRVKDFKPFEVVPASIESGLPCEGIQRMMRWVRQKEHTGELHLQANEPS